MSNKAKKILGWIMLIPAMVFASYMLYFAATRYTQDFCITLTAVALLVLTHQGLKLVSGGNWW